MREAGKICVAAIVLAAAAVPSLLSASPSPASSVDGLRPIRDNSNLYTYATVDFPGAVTTSAINGINDLGGFAGVYDDAHKHYRGFSGHLGNPALTPVDVPGAVQTFVIGVTNDDCISGTWIDSGGAQHGFVLRNGSYTTIDVPGAAPKTRGLFEFGAGLGSSVYGANALGDVVGQYADKRGLGHGFRLRGGVYETIDPLGTSRLPGGSGGSSLVRITDDGTIAGNFYQRLGSHGPAGSRARGFILRGNRFETVAVPQGVVTQVMGPSANGCATGIYFTLAQLTRLRGFTYCQGTYARIAHPEGQRLTTVSDMAVDGTLVGEFTGTDRRTHGFIATPR